MEKQFVKINGICPYVINVNEIAIIREFSDTTEITLKSGVINKVNMKISNIVRLPLLSFAELSN